MAFARARKERVSKVEEDDAVSIGHLSRGHLNPPRIVTRYKLPPHSPANSTGCPRYPLPFPSLSASSPLMYLKTDPPPGRNGNFTIARSLSRFRYFQRTKLRASVKADGQVKPIRRRPRMGESPGGKTPLSVLAKLRDRSTATHGRLRPDDVTRNCLRWRTRATREKSVPAFCK